MNEPDAKPSSEGNSRAWMVPIWQDVACFPFYAQLCLLFEKNSQRLTSSRVTEANKATEPGLGSKNKCPQCDVLEFQTQSDWFFYFILLFIAQVEAPSCRTTNPCFMIDQLKQNHVLNWYPVSAFQIKHSWTSAPRQTKFTVCIPIERQPAGR